MTPISNALTFLLVVAICPLAAAEVPKPAPRSTDDALRDVLNAQPGDDYDRALLGEPAKTDAKDRAGGDLERKLKQELGRAAQREDDQKEDVEGKGREQHRRLSRQFGPGAVEIGGASP